MTYEMIEAKIDELNEQITEIYNNIANEERWQGETTKSKKLAKQAEQLIDAKYELIDLLK